MHGLSALVTQRFTSTFVAPSSDDIGEHATPGTSPGWAPGPCSQHLTAQPRSLLRGPAGILAVSGRIVWSGNQDDFLVDSAEGLNFGIERATCGPHDQNPVVGFQELQDFGKLFFQAFGFVLGEREGRQ